MKKGCIKNIFCLLLLLLLAAQAAMPAFSANEEAPADFFAPDSGADYADPTGDNYSAVLYSNTNGLPTSAANDIVETSDGFIWIGCYSGLVRYDGNTFEHLDTTSGIANVACLFVDSRDRLWIGTNDSGLAMMDHGTVTLWSEDDGLPSSKVNAISEDRNGLIYAGTTAGIVTIDEDLNLNSFDDPRLDGIYVEMLRRGTNGRIYGISNNDDLFTIQDGVVDGYLIHNMNRVRNVVCIYPDPKSPGSVYLGTGRSELFYGDLSRNFDAHDRVDISPLTEVQDIQQFGERIWITARNGIGVLEGSDFTVLDELPMNNSVSHVMADYQGNLWFTSTRQGVMKIVPNRFFNIFERYDLPDAVVNSTCIYEDWMFIATDTGLIVLDEQNGAVPAIPLNSAQTASGEKIDATDLLEFLDGSRIRSVIRDSKNRLWISTWRSCGLICYDHGHMTVYTEADGLITENVRAVCERPDGTILVVNSGGLCILDDSGVIARYGKKDGIENTESLCVSYADNGDILLGSNGGGIYIINKDGVRCLGTKDGLKSGTIMRIKRDPVRKVFWLVASNSLAYMTEDYEITTIQKFPYPDNFDLFENSRGDMWVLSSDGIYIVSADALLSGEDLRPMHYGMANGLPCVAVANSYSELTERGNLFFSGSSCVVRVNIEEAVENVSDLKIAVPFIDADGVRIYPDESGSFHIDSSVQKLTVYSYVFTYSLTDPQVSYYLDGFDREPVTVKRSDLDPADYTNLPGGNYHFVIHLHDSLGQNDKTVSVPIIKQKALHEYIWFNILASLAFAFVLAGAILLYFRRKTLLLQKEHREAVEKERLETELQTAAQIQESMMPHIFPPFPDREEFDLYASMDPARDVGGDFYDFFLIDDDHLCLVMADVSGKGIPAALFMMNAKVILQNCAMGGNSAAEILEKTNEKLCINNQVDMFVTTWLGILEISTGTITAANAGHEYPAVMHGGQFSLLKDKHGFVLGGLAEAKYSEYTLRLKPGEKLFIYTDGVPEATASDNSMFTTDRMLEALNKDPYAKPEQILQNVRHSVDAFVKDAEQFDDLTMLCIEYHGSSSES